MTIDFSSNDVVLLVAAINKALARHRAEVNYSKKGKGKGNVVNLGRRIKKLEELRGQFIEKMQERK